MNEDGEIEQAAAMLPERDAEESGGDSNDGSGDKVAAGDNSDSDDETNIGETNEEEKNAAIDVDLLMKQLRGE